MVIESEHEWKTYRQKLILEIKDTQKSLQKVFGEVKIRLKGKIGSTNLYIKSELEDFKKEALDAYTEAAARRTAAAATLVDTSTNLAGQASEAVDKAVFGTQINVKLGTGAKDIAERLKARRYKSGFKLSDKIWPSDKKVVKDFYSTIEKGIQGGTSFNSVVEKLVELKVEKAAEKLPKYLSELDQAAKAAAQGLPNANANFQRIVGNVRRQLAKRKVAEYIRPTQQSLGILGTRQATEALLDRVEKAVAKGSQAMISDAVDKYLVKRAEYHSTRAARTMAARAFMEAGQAARMKKPWVYGEKWTLSASHPRLDECDIRATLDLGQGPGVYPKGQGPWDHVNGLCYYTDVIDEKYFERDKPFKPKWKKGWKEQIDSVQPGSPLSDYANKLGAREERGRIAPEMEKSGPHFPKTDVKPPTPKLTAKEVEDLYKLEAERMQKEAERAAKAKAVKKPQSKQPKQPKPPSPKESASTPTQPLQPPAPDAIPTQPMPPVDDALSARDRIPMDAMNKARQDVKEEVEKALLEQQKKAIEIEQAAKKANDSYVREKWLERKFSGRLKAIQEAATQQELRVVRDLERQLAEQQKRLSALEQAKVNLTPKSKIPKIPDKLEILDSSSMEQIGPQAGSNPGGLFEDKATGEKWYVKYPQSDAHARNEALAAHLYKLTGAKVPDVKLIRDANGKMGVASKIIEGLQENAQLLMSGKASGVMEGFAADAWLANWDVMGLTYDNMLVKGGKYAYRVDTGGALLFRAQGARKGAAFGNVVEEWTSFRTVQSYTTTPVFKNITEKQLLASANRVLKISDDEIRQLVKLYGMDDSLADTLIARKRFIQAEAAKLKKAGTKARVVAAAKTPEKTLTSAEWAAVEESRGNGYAVAIDKRDIEDQQILFWREKKANGDWVVNGTFKVREEALRKLNELADMADRFGPVVDNDIFFEDVEAFYKIIRDKIAAGETDVSQWSNIYRRQLQGLVNEYSQFDAAKKQYYQPWIEEIERVFNSQTASWRGPQDPLLPFTRPGSGGYPPGVVQFQKVYRDLEEKVTNKGWITRTGQLKSGSRYGFQYYYEAKLPDGTVIRYWPERTDISYFAHNRVQVISAGDQADSIFDALKQVGVDVARATASDQEELYLRQIAYAARPQKHLEFERLFIVPDQGRRIEMMKDWINTELNIPDITKLKDYNPAGTHEAFGHGRILRYRPDLTGREWSQFASKYRVFHDVEFSGHDIDDVINKVLDAGGKMTSTNDRLLRRSVIPMGASPGEDIASGGAEYFFTRIETITGMKRRRGIYWKADHLKRMDAIVYDVDNYGRTTGDFVLQNRRSTIAEFKAAARNSGNETIFKDGMSLFDKLDRIVVEQRDRQKVIDVFRRHGYQTLPDGRRIEDIIVVEAP